MKSFFNNLEKRNLKFVFDISFDYLNQFDFDEKHEANADLPAHYLIFNYDILNILPEDLFKVIQNSDTYHQNNNGVDLLMTVIFKEEILNAKILTEEQFFWLVKNSNLKNLTFSNANNKIFGQEKPLNAFYFLINRRLKKKLNYNQRNDHMYLSDNVMEYFIDHSDLNITDDEGQSCAYLLLKENFMFKNRLNKDLFLKVVNKANLDLAKKIKNTIVDSPLEQVLHSKYYYKLSNQFIISLIEKSSIADKDFFEKNILNEMRSSFDFKEINYIFELCCKRKAEKHEKFLLYIVSKNNDNLLDTVNFFESIVQENGLEFIDRENKEWRTTPLMLAIDLGKKKMIYSLLYVGADLYKKTKEFYSPASNCLEMLQEPIEKIKEKGKILIEKEKIESASLHKNNSRNNKKKML